MQDIEDKSENEIDKIEEWQKNQYNPGYYIGTGRVPKTVSGLARYPVLLIVLGVFTFIPALAVLVSGRNILSNLAIIVFSLVFSVLFIYGGIRRL